MNPIKVSVIIPIYNEEEYIRECLNSIIGQTLKDIEIICVDAGSTDSTINILKEYEKEDSRIILSYNHGKLNAGKARNIGMSLASGEYLAFLDADDYFDLNMLNEAYNKIKKEKSDIVVFDIQELDMKTGEILYSEGMLGINKITKKSPFNPEEISNRLFNIFKNWTWNKLFRREFIENNKIVFQEIERTNDMAFTCQALSMAEKISIIPKVYTTYRVGTETSLQATNSLTPTCFWGAYKETKKRLMDNNKYEIYKQSFLNEVLDGTIYNLKSVQEGEAYHEILYLIKYELNKEFELDRYPKNYYYKKFNYKEYKIITWIPKNITVLIQRLKSK